jgi:kumamolisin
VPLAPGGETTLDLEILSAAAPGLKRINVYEGGSSEAAIFETSAAALGGRGSRPDVISISLEGCEARLYGDRLFRRGLENVFGIAAGAGISTLVASGDQGSSMCTVEATGALPLLSVNGFASLDHVTAVGGTNLVLDSANAITDQIAWNDRPDQFAASGGGISILSPRPWWQRGVLSRKSTGDARTVPDLAALADVTPGYAINCTAGFATGCTDDPSGWMAIGGTSAATPLLAGGIALANQEARRAGQPPLGFLNPLIYQLAGSKTGKRIFYDVTSGDNDLGTLIPAEAGGGEPLGCCAAGPGYDPVTGWGSPDVARLSRAARRVAAG